MSTATGTAPAFVAVSSTVMVLLVSSHDDVESTNIISRVDSSCWARRIMGVTTRTAQLSSARLVMLMSVPAKQTSTPLKGREKSHIT